MPGRERPRAGSVRHNTRRGEEHPRRPGKNHSEGGPTMRLFCILLTAVALAGCQAEVPPAVNPPPDPPSGELRPDEPIPYDTLVEHLRFNTKSRMLLLRLRGRAIA